MLSAINYLIDAFRLNNNQIYPFIILFQKQKMSYQQEFLAKLESIRQRYGCSSMSKSSSIQNIPTPISSIDFQPNAIPESYVNNLRRNASYSQANFNQQFTPTKTPHKGQLERIRSKVMSGKERNYSVTEKKISSNFPNWQSYQNPEFFSHQYLEAQKKYNYEQRPKNINSFISELDSKIEEKERVLQKRVKQNVKLLEDSSRLNLFYPKDLSQKKSKINENQYKNRNIVEHKICDMMQKKLSHQYLINPKKGRENLDSGRDKNYYELDKRNEANSSTNKLFAKHSNQNLIIDRGLSQKHAINSIQGDWNVNNLQKLQSRIQSILNKNRLT